MMLRACVALRVLILPAPVVNACIGERALRLPAQKVFGSPRIGKGCADVPGATFDDAMGDLSVRGPLGSGEYLVH